MYISIKMRIVRLFIISLIVTCGINAVPLYADALLLLTTTGRVIALF